MGALLDRRAFLRRLGFGTVAAAAAATSLYDLDKLLWLPSDRVIVIPKARQFITPTWVTPTWVTNDVVGNFENILRLKDFETPFDIWAKQA